MGKIYADRQDFTKGVSLLQYNSVMEKNIKKETRCYDKSSSPEDPSQTHKNIPNRTKTDIRGNGAARVNKGILNVL